MCERLIGRRVGHQRLSIEARDEPCVGTDDAHREHIRLRNLNLREFEGVRRHIDLRRIGKLRHLHRELCRRLLRLERLERGRRIHSELCGLVGRQPSAHRRDRARLLRRGRGRHQRHRNAARHKEGQQHHQKVGCHILLLFLLLLRHAALIVVVRGAREAAPHAADELLEVVEVGVHHRRRQQREQERQHLAAHDDAGRRLAVAGAFARGRNQRNHAGHEGHRRHQNRTEPVFVGLQNRLGTRHPVTSQRLRMVHLQNAVLLHHAEEHEDAQHAEHVERLTEHIHRDHREGQGERQRRDDGDGEHPRLELRREHQVDEDHRQQQPRHKALAHRLHLTRTTRRHREDAIRHRVLLHDRLEPVADVAI